jgi:hypothetical protein
LRCCPADHLLGRADVGNLDHEHPDRCHGTEIALGSWMGIIIIDLVGSGTPVRARIRLGPLRQ